ncbi:MAG TPA: GspH/FimT family pseudopilin [Rubrivivax sp.]|jgi:type IV fimbrial biogenesis protein FimT|nr:GspH/FimT family pseudopilin [Rubrivivax sp.]
MKLRRALLQASGFTLIELLIVVALVAVILGLAGPSFMSFIQMQRLRSVNAQVVTDIQFARSEAVSRNVPVHLRFQTSAAMSCYTLYTKSVDAPSLKCDCLAAEGSRCTPPSTVEVRTVQLPVSRTVRLTATGNLADNFSFDPRTGGMVHGPIDFFTPIPDEFLVHVYIDDSRKLRNKVGLAGRISVCTPAGSTMTETACPP